MRDFQMVYGEVFEGAIYSIRRFYSVFINAQFLLVILAIGSLLIKQPVANDNNFGENTIEQDVTFLAKANPGKMIFFTDARFDGVGNEILPMMTTAAYANYRNWVFAGVIIGNTLIYLHCSELIVLILLNFLGITCRWLTRESQGRRSSWC